MLTQNPPHALRLPASRQNSASTDRGPFPKHRQPLPAIFATPLPSTSSHPHSSTHLHNAPAVPRILKPTKPPTPQPPRSPPPTRQPRGACIACVRDAATPAAPGPQPAKEKK